MNQISLKARIGNHEGTLILSRDELIQRQLDYPPIDWRRLTQALIVVAVFFWVAYLVV